MLGASIGQFGGNSTQVFFVTWFPTYLVTARGMDFLNAGMMTMLPYIGASIGRAGRRPGVRPAADQRTGSANLARKLPIVGGMLLASTIVAANFVPAGSDMLVVAIMSVAFFGQGMTNLGWTVISDVAPKELIGLTAGIFNFSANLAGIVTPLVIGYAYQSTGSFVGPLVYIGSRGAGRRLLLQRRSSATSAASNWSADGRNAGSGDAPPATWRSCAFGDSTR